MSTATDKRDLVIGVFKDNNRANQAYRFLINRGYTSDEINVMMSNETREYFAKNKDEKDHAGNLGVEGVGTGGTIGAVIGATLGALAALGTSAVVPGLGLVVAGPLLAGLAGAGAGATTGGLIGGLIGLGITESDAGAYEKVLKEGGVVLGVHPHNNDRSEIVDAFKKFDGEHIVTA